jgi:hypothetical protein
MANVSIFDSPIAALVAHHEGGHGFVGRSEINVNKLCFLPFMPNLNKLQRFSPGSIFSLFLDFSHP